MSRSRLARCAGLLTCRTASLVIGTLAAGALTSAAALAAPPAGPVHATQVSGSSPFGDATACGYFPSQFTPSKLFLNSELEPQIAVNPTDPDNIVTTWQQDRWSDGGSRGLPVGYTTTGGKKWDFSYPEVSDCTVDPNTSDATPWERASDPWVTFAPDGTLYHMSLSFDQDPAANRPGGFGPNAMLVSRSTDGGKTWGAPTTLIEDTAPTVLNDKNSMTADPNDSDYVYAVWDRLQLTTAQAIIVPDSLPRHLGIYYGVGYSGPAMISRTTDGGATWTAPRVLYDPGSNNQTINNLVEVRPQGTVIDFFTEILSFKNSSGTQPAFYANIALKRSDDHGATFQPQGQPIRAQVISSAGVVTPDTLTPVRDASILFDTAVDHSNGNLYLVWQDDRFTGVDEIAFSMSTDGGLTWSAPVRVNQTPANANLLRQQAFVPAVTVLADGTVSVTYYDFRNDVTKKKPNDPEPELADDWNVTCDPATAANGCAATADWTNEARLTSTSFDITQAPYARGYFLGDYQGLASAIDTAVAAFAQPHSSDPDSIFFAGVTP